MSFKMCRLNLRICDVFEVTHCIVRDDVYIVAICRHQVGNVSSRHPHLVFHREQTPVENSARSTYNLFVGCSSGVE